MPFYPREPEHRLVYSSRPLEANYLPDPPEEAQRGPDAFKLIGKGVLSVLNVAAKLIGKFDSPQSGLYIARSDIIEQ